MEGNFYKGLRNAILIIAAFYVVIFVGACSIAHADTFGQYASKIVGKPISVQCVKMPGNYGETYQTTNADGSDSEFDPVIHLAPETCVALKGVEMGKRNMHGANAVLTLQHEAEHIMLNSGDEGVVECNAVMHISSALAMFHANTAKMRSLVILAFEQDPPTYQTDAHCANLGMSGIKPMARKKA